MPSTIRDLYQHIGKECDGRGFSLAQRHYAAGRIFYEIFERADHEEMNGRALRPQDFDRYAQDVPIRKILRDIEEAQQEFGRAAAEFMKPVIDERIAEAIDNSVVSVVRSHVSGLRAFGMNVLAGIIGAIAFAVLIMVAAAIYQRDPSPIALGKAIEQHLVPPAAALPSPGSQEAPLEQSPQK